MSIEINLKDYEVKSPVPVGAKGRVIVQQYLKEPFLKGPVPLRWLVKAANLGKCALMVGLIFWYMDGMRSQKTFRMRERDIKGLLKVSKWTVLRGIKRLELNGLIFVLREPGCKLVVTLNRVVSSRGGSAG